MEIYILKNMFAVCKIPDFSRIDLNREFYFAANTDEECSLVCPEKKFPQIQPSAKKPARLSHLRYA